MKLIIYSLIATVLFLSTSCKKELSLELAEVHTPIVDTPIVDTPVVDTPIVDTPDVNAAKAEKFQNFILNKKFQLKAFYSDIPIDFIDNDDTVKLETNLWGYVQNYLKDDYDVFQLSTTDVNIEQNAIRMPGVNDPVLHKKYLISKDASGVHMDFLDSDYQTLRYDLDTTGADYFILSVKWKNGATLYSRFEVIP